MTTQVPVPLAPFPWAFGLQSQLRSRPLAAQQRRSLERSVEVQSITVAVRALASPVGYATLPCLEDVGRLRVHPRAGVVTTPGGFRVSFKEGQARFQGPNGLWTELEAEPPARSAAWRHPLTEHRIHFLLPDGTRLTLQHQVARPLHRVVISCGNQQLAADTALSGPVWQPVHRGPRFALGAAQPDSARYEAMIDDGLPRHTLKVHAMNRLEAWGALLLKETSAPQDSDLPELTREDLYELAGQGHNLYDTGEVDAARKVFERLTALDPNESFFHCGLGAIYQHQGDLDRAIAEYNRALALNERDIPARCNRAEVLLQQGLTEAAIEDLERISELDPHAQCSHTLRARSIALTLLSLVNGRGGPLHPSR